MNRLRVKKTRSNQSGYALVTLVFMTTAMLIAAAAVAPNIITQGRREREKEMIWRGDQYVRAVKLYYRKNARFPASLEDLTKPKTGVRYMRQAYKDPMNTKDGEWRLIYVGSAGQLIGSLKPHQTIQLPLAGPAQVGTPAANLNGTAPGTPGGSAPLPGSAPGQPQGPGGSQTSKGQPGTPPEGPPTTTGDQGEGSDTSSDDSADSPEIIGGNIIGVGSKVNHRSILVYDKATNYRQFEFIWDPSKEVGVAGQPAPQIGTPAGQPAGRSGQGPSPVTPPTPTPTENENPPQQ